MSSQTLITVADYLAQAIADQGIGHVFLVTGGGMMFLMDSVGKHPDIEVVCPHHEQTRSEEHTSELQSH